MKPVQHLGPVCALEVVANNYLFAGEGPSLKIYNYITGEKLFERIVFGRNKIHGIALANEFSIDVEADLVKIVVWGGRSLSVFTLAQFKDMKYELPHLGVGDWIFHCLFESTGKLHILDSHNIVHTVSLEEPNPKLLESRNCDWKSILYSGSLHKNEETGKITVLAGTVMNGILIWDLDTCEVKHNLTSHEGSIFKVIASPDGKYIISCSDDRSIKVWNLDSGELLANGWGHGSRIWGLNVFNVVKDGFSVFSCSEDCTARVWTFRVGSCELKQERIILNHTGRHVWSCALDDTNKLGFTGGADGKIVITDLAETERPGYWGHKWELQDITKQSGQTFTKGELLKEYVDFGHGLLAVTSEGRVLVLQNFKKWVLLFEDSRFERFCVLKGYKDVPIIALGNKLGDVILMKLNKDCELEVRNEIKVNDSFDRLGNLLTHEYDGRLFVLLESPNPRAPLIYKEIDPETLEIISTTNLIKPNDKIKISSVDFDASKSYLIVGCRFATLMVYQIQPGCTEIVPLVTYKNLFKGDTVSSLKVIPNEKNCTFYVTNKDSTYHIMEIKENLEYEFLQSSRIQKGFLEGLVILPNGDNVLYGFKSDSFFIWNETRQYEMMREICGGPHRRWEFKYWFNNDELKYRFIYTRSDEVQIVQNGKSPFRNSILETGLHGREIRDICVVDSLKSKDEKVVITGSEDTTLKIGTLRSNGEFELHCTYREHVAGLQSIHAVNNQYIVSTSAREELHLWKINELENAKFLSLHNSLPPGEENPDLRIMDFDTLQVFDEKNEPVGFLLVAVYSNSTVKVVYYDFDNNKFSIIIADKYMTCCIFNTRFLKLHEEIYILLGSTNGHVTIYDINEHIKKHFKSDGNGILKLINNNICETQKLDKLILNQQLHQSSIKSLDLLQTSDDNILLVTAGDDNALIVSNIEQENESDCIKLDVKSFHSSAASSTITTVDIVDADSVLVGAVDQTVKLWDISSEDLKLKEDKYSTVADIGCNELVQFSNGNRYTLVGGSGFSIWEL